MTKKETTKKIVVSEPTTAIVEYTSVNFDDLNDSITKLGNYKGRLGKDDKKVGTQLLDEWKTNVIDRIDVKERELTDIENFFGVRYGNGRNYYNYNNYDGDNYITLRNNLAMISGTEKQYKAWEDIKEEIGLHSLTRPQKPVWNPEISEIDNDKSYTSYHKKDIEWEITDKKLSYKEKQSWNAWLIAMKKSPKIKEFLIQIKDYRKQLDSYKNECATKTHMAKVNLAISNADVRNSIQELLKFSEKFRPMK